MLWESNELVDNSVKTAELKLAAYVACHSSISTIHYLGELINSICGKDLSLHRTKCTALIRSVLGSAFRQELVGDINSSGSVLYSLLMDESTDVQEKQICLMVRFFHLQPGGF